MQVFQLFAAFVLFFGIISGSDEVLVTEDGDSVVEKQQIIEESTVILLTVEEIAKFTVSTQTTVYYINQLCL